MVFLLFILSYLDFRGIWVPRWSIPDNKIFYYLDGEFNHIFLQIFALGEAYYSSAYAPNKFTSDKWLKDFLIGAHQRNIKVSAWINVFYSWGYASLTTNSKHPINCSRYWYVYDKDNRSILDYNIDELKALGLEGYFLSPGNYYAREYLIRLTEEIVSKYDFDGIHLDYIRYPNNQFIYDAHLRTKFMRKFYLDPLALYGSDDLRTRFSLWGYEDLKNRWHKFVMDDLTLFIKDLSERVKKIKPHIHISAAVKPDYLTARDEYYQDWPSWLNSGFIDFVCLMAYDKNIKSILNRNLGAVKEPYRIVVGLGLHSLPSATIRKQVDLVRGLPYAGITYFSYEELKKNRDYLYSLRR